MNKISRLVAAVAFVALGAAPAAGSAGSIRLTLLDGSRTHMGEEAVVCTLVVFSPTGDPLGSDWRIGWGGQGISPALLPVPSGSPGGVLGLPTLVPTSDLVTLADYFARTRIATTVDASDVADSAVVVLRIPALTHLQVRAYPSNVSRAAVEHESLSTVRFNPGPSVSMPPVIASATMGRAVGQIRGVAHVYEFEDITRAELVYGVSGARIALEWQLSGDSLLFSLPGMILPPTAWLEIENAAGQIGSLDVEVPELTSSAPGRADHLIVRFLPRQVEPLTGTAGGLLAEMTFADPQLRDDLGAAGIVRLDPAFPRFQHSDTLSTNLRGEPVRLIDLADIYIASGGEGLLLGGPETISNSPGVVYACPNVPQYALQAVPQDDYFPQQWGLHNTGQVICGRTAAPDIDIDAPEAWDIATGTNSVSIAILDSGLDATHPDFWYDGTERYYLGQDQVFSVPGAPYPIDDDPQRHGTATAGIIGGSSNNGYGGAGITWGTKLFPLKVSKELYGTAPLSVAQAIDWSCDSTSERAPIPILSLGVGFYATDATPSQLLPLNDACYNALQRGHLVVAPMGNRDANDPLWPAAFSNRAYAVGAAWMTGARWSDDLVLFPPAQGDAGSNFGSWIDIAAPGGRMIIAPGPGQGVDDMYEMSGCNEPLQSNNTAAMGFGGTSAAVPVVAGVAGLLRSIPINPDATLLGEDLEQIMNRTASQNGSWNPDLGYGVVNARAAIDFIDPGSKYVLQGTIGFGGSHGALSVVSVKSADLTLRGIPNLPDGVYNDVQVYKLRGTGLLGAQFTNPPASWIRSSGSEGIKDTLVFDYRHEVRWGRIVSQPTANELMVETYVYDIPGHGFFPVAPQHAKLAFTAIGSSALVGVDDNSSEGVLYLKVSPSPLTSATSISLAVPDANVDTWIEIVSASGRRVRLLYDGTLPAGPHSVTWNARDESGRRVRPGVYFLRASVGERNFVRKLTVLSGSDR